MIALNLLLSMDTTASINTSGPDKSHHDALIHVADIFTVITPEPCDGLKVRGRPTGQPRRFDAARAPAPDAGSIAGD